MKKISYILLLVLLFVGILEPKIRYAFIYKEFLVGIVLGLILGTLIAWLSYKFSKGKWDIVITSLVVSIILLEVLVGFSFLELFR